MADKKPEKKKALGRGLSALLENTQTDVTSRIGSQDNPALVGSVSKLPVQHIEANPFQPRTQFEQEALTELSDSIREHGLIQPVTVRKMGYDRYQLVSGERRFRASQLVGLEEIPAYIIVANDQAMLEMALVENIQRENLDPIEIAIGYQRLIDEVKLTQEELSRKVGKKRATVTNYLRLLKLPAEVQLGLRNRVISMGHARALLGLDSAEAQRALFTIIVNDELSVRQVEQRVRDKNIPSVSTPSGPKAPESLPADIQQVQDNLSQHLKTNVSLKPSKKGNGKIIIPYASQHELERLLELLRG
ncbi:MAG: ParB/RepB/Spo0J family partition protein [Salibacteraceae bacterium]